MPDTTSISRHRGPGRFWFSRPLSRDARIVPLLRRCRDVAIGLLFLMSLAAGPAVAQTRPPAGEVPLEERVKAAALFKFIGYVEWPAAVTPGPTKPYVVAVAGSPAIATELKTVATGRLVNERPVTVRSVTEADSLSEVHLLFVSRSERSRLGKWVQLSQPLPILLVTDIDGGLLSGSVINFIVDDRIEFEISLPAADRAQLKISSRLLAVAKTVLKGIPP